MPLLMSTIPQMLFFTITIGHQKKTGYQKELMKSSMVRSTISFTGIGNPKRQREVHMCGVYENVITCDIEIDQLYC